MAILAIAGAAYLYRQTRIHKKDQLPANAFYEVKRGDMLVSVIEDGALRALNETVIRSGLEGLNRIIHLVPEGTYVKKGELLAELDSSTLNDRLNEQELAYEDRKFFLLQARENVKFQKSLAESQIKDAELLILNSQDDLEKFRDGAAPLVIRTAEARITVLKEQVRIAKDRYVRTQELFKTSNATRSEVEADRLTLEREELGLAQYEEDLRLIKKFDQPTMIRSLAAKIDQSKEELDRLKQRTASEIEQAEADLKSSERAFKLLEENLDTLRKRLENAKIYAPQDGLVVYAEVSQFQYYSGDSSSSRYRYRGVGSGSYSDSAYNYNSGRKRGSGFGTSSELGGQPTSSTAVTNSAAPTANAIANGDATQTSDSFNATAAFVAYESLRPSSKLRATIGAAGDNLAASSSTSSSASSQSSYSGGGSSGGYNQYYRRSSYDGSEVYDSSGFIAEGSMVRQRQELIRLPDISKMLAEVKIRENYARLVRSGMAAYVRVETIPERRFKATVRHVALLPDAQSGWMSPDIKVFPTDVLIEDELPALKPGVSARVEIIVTNLTQILSVPIQSVARLEGEYVCFVKKGSKVVATPVKTGFSNDRFMEITAGLREGDRVLLATNTEEEMDDSSQTDTNAVQKIEGDTNAPPAAETDRDPTERRPRRQRNPDPQQSPPDNSTPPEKSEK